MAARPAAFSRVVNSPANCSVAMETQQGPPSLALGEGQIQVSAGDQRRDRESLRVPLNDGKGAGPDGTRRTEDANVLQRKLARSKYS